jgi:hypothetical protein
MIPSFGAEYYDQQQGRSAAVFASVHAIEEYVPGNA